MLILNIKQREMDKVEITAFVLKLPICVNIYWFFLNTRCYKLRVCVPHQNVTASHSCLPSQHKAWYATQLLVRLGHHDGYRSLGPVVEYSRQVSFPRTENIVLSSGTKSRANFALLSTELHRR